MLTHRNRPIMRYVVSHLLSVIWGINIGAFVVSISLDHLDYLESFLSRIFGERFQIWMVSLGTHAEAQLYLAQTFVSAFGAVFGVLCLILLFCQKYE